MLDEKALAKQNGMTYDELEDIWAGFRDRQTFVNCCNVIVAVLFLFGVHSALVALNRQIAAIDNPGYIHLFPESAVWWFLPGFGAMTLPWEITIRIWSLFADKRKVHLYREWAKRETSMYKGRAFRNEFGLYHFFALTIVLPIAIATLLALNMHATLGPAAIRDCGYAFKSCEIFPYDEVQKMTELPGQETAKTRVGSRVDLDLKDGRRWSSSDWGGSDQDVDPAVVLYLASKVK
jgi:hypothetical protein